MGHLFNRRVLLCICGGIAAYKSAELLRKLQEFGADVRVLMTHGAQEFITPLTLQVLSKNPVVTGLYDEKESCSDTRLSNAVVAYCNSCVRRHQCFNLPSHRSHFRNPGTGSRNKRPCCRAPPIKPDQH